MLISLGSKAAITMRLPNCSPIPVYNFDYSDCHYLLVAAGFPYEVDKVRTRVGRGSSTHQLKHQIVCPELFFGHGSHILIWFLSFPGLVFLDNVRNGNDGRGLFSPLLPFLIRGPACFESNCSHSFCELPVPPPREPTWFPTPCAPRPPLDIQLTAKEEAWLTWFCCWLAHIVSKFKDVTFKGTLTCPPTAIELAVFSSNTFGSRTSVAGSFPPVACTSASSLSSWKPSVISKVQIWSVVVILDWTQKERQLWCCPRVKYGVASFSGCTKFIIIWVSSFTRIAPKDYWLFSNMNNLEWARTIRSLPKVPTWLVKNIQFSWKFRYDWVDYRWQGARKGHPSEHYSGLRWLTLGFPMESKLRPWV